MKQSPFGILEISLNYISILRHQQFYLLKYWKGDQSAYYQNKSRDNHSWVLFSYVHRTTTIGAGLLLFTQR